MRRPLFLAMPPWIRRVTSPTSRSSSRPESPAPPPDGHILLAAFLRRSRLGRRARARAPLITISLALATLPFGLALGLLVALLKRSDSAILRGDRHRLHHRVPRPARAAHALHRLFRPPDRPAEGLEGRRLPSNLEMPAFVAGMIALGLVLARVLLARSGSARSTRSRRASARAPSRSASPRPSPSASSCFPQLMRVALPGLGNNWMVLLKETSLDLRHRAARPDVLDRAGQRGDQGAVPVLRRGLPHLPLLLARLGLRASNCSSGAPIAASPSDREAAR